MGDQFSGKTGQPVVFAFGKAVLDCRVAAVYNAGLAESFPECGDFADRDVGRIAAEIADRPQLSLLAQGGKRRHRDGTEHSDNLAPLHSMTSSAWAKRDCGTVRPSARAVFRLMDSSNVAGAITGRSAGLAPLRIFPA